MIVSHIYVIKNFKWHNVALNQYQSIPNIKNKLQYYGAQNLSLIKLVSRMCRLLQEQLKSLMLLSGISYSPSCKF